MRFQQQSHNWVVWQFYLLHVSIFLCFDRLLTFSIAYPYGLELRVLTYFPSNMCILELVTSFIHLCSFTVISFKLCSILCRWAWSMFSTLLWALVHLRCLQHLTGLAGYLDYASFVYWHSLGKPCTYNCSSRWILTIILSGNWSHHFFLLCVYEGCVILLA
jgi:hypothetical protein